MELRPADKLILLMLTEIYDALKIKREVDPEFVREVLFGGHTWALDWKMPGLFGSDRDVSKQIVSDVVDILDMHSFLEPSYAALTPAEQAQIEHSWALQFHGFDGNNETEYMSVARFLVEQLNRFTDFAKRDFNSHAPTVDRSLAMAREFQSIRAQLNDQFRLSLEQIKQVLAAANLR